MKRPCMLVLGWASKGTGFTRVLTEILRPLTPYFEIHQVGVGYYGEAIHQDWSLYPCSPDGSDIYGVFAAQELLDQLNPKILFILHDIWMFDYYFRILKPEERELSTVVYFPLDGLIRNVDIAKPLLKADRIVTYTPEAARETSRALQAVVSQDQTAPHVHVIPHGVDMKQFYPKTSDILSNKRAVFPGTPELETSFIVLNASRPAIRKRLDITLKGFAIFARNKPKNVILCLHHAKNNETAHQQLVDMASELGILDRIVWNPLSAGETPLSDQDLNCLYNACDVGINTSTGEGWGLVSCEHAAAGKAQIVPDHSACSELWQDAAVLIPPSLREIPSYSPLEMAEISPANLASALERLYHNPELRTRLAKAGKVRMDKPEWQWSKISEQWKNLALELI